MERPGSRTEIIGNGLILIVTQTADEPSALDPLDPVLDPLADTGEAVEQTVQSTGDAVDQSVDSTDAAADALVDEVAGSPIVDEEIELTQGAIEADISTGAQQTETAIAVASQPVIVAGVSSGPATTAAVSTAATTAKRLL